MASRLCGVFIYNMGAEATLMALALQQREASDYGATLTRGNNTYPVSISSIGFNSRLVNGGFSPNTELTIVIRKAVLGNAAPFQTGEPLSIKDANGDVRNVKIAGEGIRDDLFCWELTCNDQNQGA